MKKKQDWIKKQIGNTTVLLSSTSSLRNVIGRIREKAKKQEVRPEPK
jgi:hypothetical protein